MNKRYTAEHVWIQPLNAAHTEAAIGITPHAQETLGDVVFVDLPPIGKSISQNEVAGIVESVKTAADVYMPADGEVIAVNEALRADPAMTNSAPLTEAWFFKIRLSHPAQLTALMDEAAYAQFMQTV
jgi:glycine cleavage system H protein